MSTLYVTEPGAQIEKEYRHLVVVVGEETQLRVPLTEVSHVVLVGQGVGVTTPTLHALLDANIPLSLVRSNGELVGRLTPPAGRNVELRRQQYVRAADPAFCLAVSRAIVMGKLRNYQALALRWTRAAGSPTDGRADATAEIERLAAGIEAAQGAADLAALRWIEGSASKAYFAVLRLRLSAGFTFEKRTRRPPRDPVNSLLSLAYTLLGEAAATALEIVGLDPYDGFYHADAYGRPALALDLIEEFRGPVADSVVFNLINHRVLTPADFNVNEATGGVYLNPIGLKRFLVAFSARLQTTLTHPTAGRPLTYQKCMEVQARLLRKTITGELPAYRPLRVR